MKGKRRHYGKKIKTQVEKEKIKCVAKFLVLDVNKSSFKSKYIVDSYKLNLAVYAMTVSNLLLWL